jgi:hypothetical protein
MDRKTGFYEQCVRKKPDRSSVTIRKGMNPDKSVMRGSNFQKIILWFFRLVYKVKKLIHIPLRKPAANGVLSGTFS